jgi:tetratricopeptide (TPR) repeat protein
VSILGISRVSAHPTKVAFGKLLLSTLACCVFAGASLKAQTQVPVAVYEKAAATIRAENFPEAEQILQQILHEHPHEVLALSLMGVVLDAQKRFEEAEDYYQRAVKLNPRAASVLNNLGNHYLQRGDLAKAQAAYLRVLAVDPQHPNANRQLAEISVAAGKGAAALGYLDRLPAEDQSAPAIWILRAQALRLAGREKEGAELLGKLEAQAAGDARLTYSLGMIYAEWKHYEDAERAFTKALQISPANFDILYNLGLAALRAKHLDRAREVLEIALQQRPEDVGLLQTLARVYREAGRQDQAMVLLVRAEKIAPNQPDIQMFLAHLAEEEGFFGDAATAYDRYYQLRPQDDTIRRQRGFAYARSGRIEDGLKDIRWYVEKHPQDALGWYQLGAVETMADRERAFECFNKAVALDPKLSVARYARGVSLLEEGKPAAALEDFKFTLAHDPKDFNALDALGEAQLRLDRVEEAVESFRQAVELSPKDRKFLMHYGRALQRAGRREEAQAVFNRFKDARGDDYNRRARAGLLAYLRLPAEQQREQYLRNLRAAITAKPDDVALQVQLGKALLMEGDTGEALEAFHAVLKLTSDPDVLADCASTLLSAEQYVVAKEFLSRLLEARPDSATVRIDLAIAVFHSESAEAGLVELEKIPPDKRDGDFFLLRAQILDALGRSPEAAKDLDRGLLAEPTRSDLYFEAALFLLKHQRYELASKLLEKAVRTVPDSPELQLTQAIVYAILREHDTAQELLSKIEARWPEWSVPYMIHGIILTIRRRASEAEPLLVTAISLGSENPAAYYYLALARTTETPPRPQEAQEAIVKALQLNPEDAFNQSLAGRVAFLLKDYQAAEKHLQEALRLWPDMVEAHQTLSGVYRALGEKEKSIAELKEVLRIKQTTRDADQSPPFPTGDLLFTVRPPAVPPS